MSGTGAEKLALQLFLYTLLVFAAMQVAAIITGGSGSQEVFEVFADPSSYSENLAQADGPLRLILLLDVFFMIGYGGALTMTAYANAPRNRVMAWVAGLGVAALVALDIGENLTMVISLDMLAAELELSPARIGWQVGISGAKWLVAALSVVALTFTLPQDTSVERLLVWAARILLPLGAGLFVTGAFEARMLGGMLILAGMAGGFFLLALTIWLRQRQ
ncbi:MAG: hypothetical protein GY945_14825 [Rhodobacteraceae bacterium]|nr:hypothetical protein [Paracoccaceae bacterium]